MRNPLQIPIGLELANQKPWQLLTLILFTVVGRGIFGQLETIKGSLYSPPLQQWILSQPTSSPISELHFGGTRGKSGVPTYGEDPLLELELHGAIAGAVIQDDEVADFNTSNPFPIFHRNRVVDSFFAAPSESTSRDLKEDIHERAQQIQDFLVSTRRELHRYPELMYNEEKTSAYVQSVLRQLDIPFTTGWGKNTNDKIPGPGGYGIVADIGTGGEPCVLLRADMDALPILELTNGIDDFKSRHEGKMHACGHDGHSTMLLGAAALLKDMEASINGTIRLMFQPAEEGGAGGKRMREEGVLTQYPRPQQAFAMHVWPHLPSGTIASRPGPVKAAADRFEIVISGVGGHAGYPHLTVDPIVTASSIVMSLQTIVSRTVSPLDSGVVSVTKFEAGQAFNTIPGSALLRGTIRALSPETLVTLRDRVDHIVRSQAAVHGCNVTIQYSADFYPPLINDPELYESFSKEVGELVSESGSVVGVEPTMGAEDFSFVAETIPSTFFLLGTGSGQSPETNLGLHNPHFAIDEAVLPRGVELHVNLALRALQRLSQDDRML